jgi:hypothetical protein
MPDAIRHPQTPTFLKEHQLILISARHEVSYRAMNCSSGTMGRPLQP